MGKAVCLIIKPGFLHSTIIEHVFLKFNILSHVVCRLSYQEAAQHYVEHKDKKFFHGLCEYLSSDKVMILIAEEESIEDARKKTGEIRELYGVDVCRNVLHCSDSEEAGKREISLFFERW